MIPHLVCTNGILSCVAEQRSYSVYFLQSTISDRTYVGYSVDPFNRIKCHNGYKTGGAERTKTGRPWKIVLIISGFPTSRAALQFEKGWHRARATRERIKNGPDGKRRYRACPHIIDCKKGLQYMLNRKWTETAPEPFSFPLTVMWNVNENLPTYKWDTKKYDFQCWSIYQGNINYDMLIEQVTGINMYRC